MISIKGAFTILILFLIKYTTAQPLIQVKNYSVNEGLSHTKVESIIQDSKGYMWFGTWNGLNRFDGYNFKYFNSVTNKNSTLTDNRINLVKENNFGSIWCRTYSGNAYLFDVNHEVFHDIIGQNTENSIARKYVADIKCLGRGVTWIIFQNNDLLRIVEDKNIENYRLEYFNNLVRKHNNDAQISIKMDSDGEEWVFTDNGPKIVGKKSIDTSIPFSWSIEKNKRIFLISKNKDFAEYNKYTGVIHLIKCEYPFQHINCINNLKGPNIGIGTDNGLLVYNITTNSFRHFNINTKPGYSNNVFYMYEDGLGELWIYTSRSGITRLNIKTSEIQYLLSPEEGTFKQIRGTSRFVGEDEYGNLWMIPRNGYLCYYDREVKKLKYACINPYDPGTVFLPNIRRLKTDNRGALWYISGDKTGIFNVCFLPDNFELINANKDKDTRALLFDHSGNFWVGTKGGGVAVYDRKNKLLGFLNKSGSLQKEEGEFKINPYCLFEDSDHKIWIGTKLNGLYLLKRKNKANNNFSIFHYSNDNPAPYNLNANSIYSIFEDSHQRIWLGCYGGGVNLLDMADNEETRFINKSNKLKNFPGVLCSKVRFITETDNNIMMVATTDGLLTFSSNFKEPEEIIFYHNNRKQGETSCLSNNDIMHICKDSRKNIYLSTASGGINKVISSHLLSDSILFKSYTVKDGLFSEVCLSIIEDQKNTLWIVSENALSMFDPVNENFEILNRPGFSNNLVFTEAIPVKHGNEIFFGTEIGVVKIKPDELQINNYTPPVEFTSLKIVSADTQKNVTGLNKILIQPGERNLYFQYAALDYANPDGIRYAYRMEGLEKEWNYVDNNRSASYLNLPEGSFRLQVKSTKSYGPWADNIKSISVVVKPTLWETPWAWVIYMLALILIVFISVYIVLYIYKLRNQVQFEKQLTRVKLQFFTDISHELRTPLTLISNPVEELLETEPLSPKAKSHLNLIRSNTSRMIKLVNQVLDFRKIQNNKMKIVIEQFDIVPFTSKIAGDFNLLAKEKRITFNIEHEMGSCFIYSDKDKIEKITFNLLSNAFKYTPNDKKITVHTQFEDNIFTLKVKDEGIGIQQNKLNNIFQRFETAINYDFTKSSSGIGLSLVKELVDIMHGKIKVSSTPGKGSEFTVALPVSRSDFEKDPLAEFIMNDGDSLKPKTATANEYTNDGERITILLVEDNAELLYFMENILHGQYHIISATNGKEGTEKAKLVMPDLIVSDVMMPVMDGLDMVKNIKEDPNISHIPIILLSAKGSLDDRIKGLEYGIDDYIPKPFNSKYLKARIQGLIGQRKNLKDYYLGLFIKDKNGTRPDIDLSAPVINNTTDDFVKNVMGFIEKNLEHSDIKIDDFAKSLSLSRTIFYRKLKTIIGLSPIEFIIEMRIKRAIQYIETSEYSFAEIAYKTGFNEPQYFSKCFKKQTGMTPSEYKNSIG